MPFDNLQTGALIPHSPTAGGRPSNWGIPGGINETSFASNGGYADAGRLAGCCQPAPPAPSALETLGAMRPTGSTADWPESSADRRESGSGQAESDQDQAAGGFQISLYAWCPMPAISQSARRASRPSSARASRRSGSVTDRARGGVGDEVKEFAPTLPKKIPNGGCFSKDGFLYIAEQNRVLEYPAAEFFYESPDVVAGVVVPEGELIPKSEESYNHTARVCRVGPDNKLYIQLGQPYNVPAKEKFDCTASSASAASSAWTVTARTARSTRVGLRNPVGMDFHPKDKSLWINDNQVDGMGDDNPPGEMNRIASAGQDFGFPWYGGGKYPHQRVQERYPARQRGLP